jgi:hypothetical protein
MPVAASQQANAVRVASLEVLAELQGNPADVARIEAILNRLQNAAYTEGFMAAKADIRKHII